MRNNAVAAMVLAWVSGCLPACPGEPAPPCTRDRDCAFVQVCQDNQCVDGPLAAGLPLLPPEDGAATVNAHVIEDPAELLTGHAAQGAVGDILMRNTVAAFVIQKTGRDFGVAMFGGNPIDAVPVVAGQPAPDEFGELTPLLNLGMGVDFTQIEIVRSGDSGGPAVVRAYGRPMLWDYVNIAGYLADGFSNLTPFDPDEPLDLRVVATYQLDPASTVLHVTYTMINDASFGRRMPVGVTLDSGGVVEFFRSTGGFGAPSYSAASILEAAKAVPWFGFMGQDSSSVIRPRPLFGDQMLDSQNPTVQVAGVTVSLFSRPDVLAAVGDADFYMLPGEVHSFGLDVAVADGNLAAAAAAVLAAQGRQTRSISVTVQEEGGTTAVPGALVVLRGVDNQSQLTEPIVAGRTNASGDVTLVVPPQTVAVQVKVDGHTAPAAQTLAQGTDTAVIHVGRNATLTYRVLRAADTKTLATERGPCRITVVGPEQVPDAVIRAASNDRPPNGVVALRSSATCSSDDDGSIPLQPGRYLVVATAGPMFDAQQWLVDVSATAQTAVDGTLHRVVDLGQYVSTDWHQHSVNSPDAPVALLNRALGYLAEGIELFGGSDHDYFTDWEALVQQMGFADRLQAINGVESTTFDYGHFNVFPVTRQPGKVNGGPVDWAGGDGPGLTPPQMWAAYRERGAQVVQVNHPLSSAGGYFTRSALTFELNTTTMQGVARGDPGSQPVSNEKLRLPPLEPLWGPAFDAVEVYNGFTRYPGGVNTRTLGDKKADQILMYVSNLIHVGHRPIMTGTSDSHRFNAGDNGYPRTYVRANRTLDGKPDPWSVLAALQGLGNAENRGDVVASNAPLPQVTAQIGNFVAGPGGLLRGAGTVDIHIDVSTPAWMSLDTADVLVSPMWDGQAFPDAQPAFTPTHSVALGAPSATTLANGGVQHRYQATLSVNLAQDNPFVGRDAFLVVRVMGRKVLWPVLLDGISLTVDENAATAEDFLTVANGNTPYAVTNPIYVDVNADGRFTGPFEP